MASITGTFAAAFPTAIPTALPTLVSSTPVSAATNILEAAGGKPACGKKLEPGEEAEEYDLPLHVLALFLVLIFSILGAGFPVMAKKVKWIKVPAKVFFCCKHFGTGVLIATAFVHLLPTAFGSLTDPCLPDLFTDIYPATPGLIMMIAMFALFVVEMWLNGKTGGHSHGGPTGFESGPMNLNHGGAHGPHGHSHHQHGPAAAPQRPPRYTRDVDFETEDIQYEKKIAQKMYDEGVRADPYGGDPYGDPFADGNQLEPRSEMPPWFIVFYEQYVRQRLEIVNMIKASSGGSAAPINNNKHQSMIPQAAQAPLIDSPYIDVETGQPVDPAVYKKMAMNITLLEGGILFHSVFVGMTVSITIDGFIVLLVAILFHQMFEGLGLGSRIAAVPYKQGSIRPWVLVVAFGTTAPIGQALGLALQGQYDPDSAFGLIIVGVFNAISSGLLLYASMVDLLAEDFLSEEANRTLTSKDKKLAFFFVLLGAIAMSVVGAFA
ncbi:Zinc/iron permease [Rhypophila decipiens]|uniref:Zinc/iron permease n=1 Tax=Rhypophila decipiens TaxID=261697 RepID=A0AAN7BDP3_9PEZI|nr:Zinc/iron permease [Rhypophila decipiens]